MAAARAPIYMLPLDSAKAAAAAKSWLQTSQGAKEDHYFATQHAHHVLYGLLTFVLVHKCPRVYENVMESVKLLLPTQWGQCFCPTPSAFLPSSIFPTLT
eukprot:1157302-Pelagomonas_calceolata.AAC.17